MSGECGAIARAGRLLSGRARAACRLPELPGYTTTLSILVARWLLQDHCCGCKKRVEEHTSKLVLYRKMNKNAYY